MFAELVGVVGVPKRLQRMTILKVTAIAPQRKHVVVTRSRDGRSEEQRLADVLRPLFVEEIAVARLGDARSVVRPIVDGVAERQFLNVVPVVPRVGVVLAHEGRARIARGRAVADAGRRDAVEGKLLALNAAVARADDSDALL